MRRWTLRILLGLVVLLVVAQLVRLKHLNPPEDPARTLEAHAPVPPEVKAILDRSCADCHSNRTHWPWYTQVAPSSWLVVSDVNEGRRELNLSDWAQYDPKRESHKLAGICHEVTEGDMPPFQYLLIHRHAKLSKAEVDTLCAWTRDTAKKLGLPPVTPRPRG